MAGFRIRGGHAFALMSVGQLASTIGSGLTSFALGIWVYQTTGSVTRFAMVQLSFWLPVILGSPIAGALVDRWDRQRAGARHRALLPAAGRGECNTVRGAPGDRLSELRRCMRRPPPQEKRAAHPAGCAARLR